METLIISKIAESITSIPGILGLASLDFAEKEAPLKERDYIKSIALNGDEEVTVSIAIILSYDLPSKIVVKEITKAVTNIFKKTTSELGNVEIYIRGVK